MSHRARAQLEAWRGALGEGAQVAVAVLDVIAQRPLARGLTAELGIDHQSPQALWFAQGELVDHGSHGALTVQWFGERLHP